MKIKIWILIALVTAFSNSLKAQDALEIAKKSSNMINLDALEMVSTLKIYNEKGDERVRKIATATKKFGETTKMMMKFTDPADVRGTTLLVYDYENKNDDMWIFMPALRKIRRIVSSEKGKNFMGSEFTNADMSKPNFDEFNYKNIGEETVDGKLCWKIESACKNEALETENGFSKRVTYIEKNNFLAHKIEYYGLNGVLLRVETINNYQKQPNGSYFAFNMEMKNLQNGRKSVMTIDKFQPSSALPESSFRQQ